MEITTTFIIEHKGGQATGTGIDLVNDAVKECAQFCYEYDLDEMEISSAGASIDGEVIAAPWSSSLHELERQIVAELEEFKRGVSEEREGREAIESDFRDSI